MDKASRWPRQRGLLLIVVIALCAPLLIVAGAGQVVAAGTTYYVTCSGGNDSSPGTSQASAWNTLDRANQASLKPGDQLLLQRGCSWTGPLKASWTGTADQPITIGAYGSGAQPKIAHAGTHNVLITGAYQIIEDLQTEHVPGDYPETYEGSPMGWKLGFNFQDQAHHNTLRRVRTSGHAIGVNFGDYTQYNRVLASQIVDNFGLFAKNNAATGILLHGHANEIAYNHFQNNQALLLPHRAVSLEVYNATSSNIHHNTSYDNKFAELGSGPVISRDNTFAYNVYASRYTPADGRKGAIFVVTRGQGCNFGPVWNTRLFNNVVYLTGGSSEGVVAGCSSPEVLTMRNNIIVAKNKALYIGGGGMVESHNIYWHPENTPPKYNFVQNWTMDETSKLTDPKFVDPAAGDFRLAGGSPAIDVGSGASMEAGYLVDLLGVNVPTGGAVDIGAYEAGTTPAPVPEPTLDLESEPASNCTYFVETGFSLCGGFRQYWHEFGGLAVYGFPITDEYRDPATGRVTQWFERARLEWQAGSWPERYDVLLGLLGREITTDRVHDAAFQPAAGIPSQDCTFYEATGHNLCGGFRAYWERFGGMAVYGMPISEEFTENGLTVQYFERQRVEWHPGEWPERFDVMLGRLGAQLQQ